jgi:hypothetical protein
MRIRGEKPYRLSAPERFGLTGMRIADLESRMRAGRCSLAGFLGRNERLLDVLSKDETTIINWIRSDKPENLNKAYGVLANLLRKIKSVGTNQTLLVNGQRFYVKKSIYLGAQECPYGDKAAANGDSIVVNAETGQVLQFSDLMPHLIEKHNFFEGEGTPYRVSPQSIIDFFNLKPNQSPIVDIRPSQAYARYEAQVKFIRDFKGIVRQDIEKARSQMKQLIIPENLPDIPPEILEQFYGEIEGSLSRGIKNLFKRDKLYSWLNAQLVMALNILPRNEEFLFTPDHAADIPGYRFAEFALILIEVRQQQAADYVIG